MAETRPLQVGELFQEMPTLRGERWNLLRRFFSGWLGPLGPADGCTRQSVSAAERRLQVVLPPSLREWYEFAGQRSAVWSCQDHFLTPDEVRVKNDRLIICVENQAVVKWAIPFDVISEEDPPVFVSDRYDDRRWIKEAPSTSSFALAKMLLDAKFSDATRFSANSHERRSADDAERRVHDFADFRVVRRTTT
jgi:hypothetical protein